MSENVCKYVLNPCTRCGTPTIQCKGHCELKDTYDQMKVAYDKSISKPLIRIETGGWKCPDCGAFYSVWKGKFIDTNFCANCGTAFDWKHTKRK